jgi:hypothetical protein
MLAGKQAVLSGRPVSAELDGLLSRLPGLLDPSSGVAMDHMAPEQPRSEVGVLPRRHPSQLLLQPDGGDDKKCPGGDNCVLPTGMHRNKRKPVHRVPAVSILEEDDRPLPREPGPDDPFSMGR